ncbi:(2Fe-2S)-binding protein [Pullulanibacillus sp. KACC 23026]|uniref:(2Fe-2S)-binding protein n=1 Tax=Pullulanibacillus sp. KACC 23026 TaxID=3028315 RepID=UPI0023B1565A|nr:(2Fe-2S)-binding protein [Pullulanibacillus sp. KACC 23026]WEG14941.1 (2Fe-2S)-binding protein [Pullulanibacillus sp. KACC 23026]
MEITFQINNQLTTFKTEPTTPLIQLLRSERQLTGAKLSCGIGRCGACSILMDGELVNACLIMAYQASGTSILTIEGLNEEGGHPIQKALLEEGGLQCGYCTPGMVMAITALFKRTPQPTDEEIMEGLSGNLCRCTGYTGIIRAIRRCMN